MATFILFKHITDAGSAINVNRIDKKFRWKDDIFLNFNTKSEKKSFSNFLQVSRGDLSLILALLNLANCDEQRSSGMWGLITYNGQSWS